MSGLKTTGGYLLLVVFLSNLFLSGCRDRTDLEVTGPPGRPTNPQPPNRTHLVPVTTNLSWEPGELAYIFNVYLGTDYEAVQSADKSSPQFMGSTTKSCYDIPGCLDCLTTYYWRVDSFNAAGATTGDIWYFTTLSLPPPEAGFSAYPTMGDRPLLVSFTDCSTGPVTSWAWDFNNDRTIDSTAQNPFFEYFLAGAYSPVLTVSGPSGPDTHIKKHYILVDLDNANAIYVCCEKGDDDNSGTSWNDPVATIQRGIDLVQDGWTVLIAPGIYSGEGNCELDFGGKAITVKCAGPAGSCIISP